MAGVALRPLVVSRRRDVGGSPWSGRAGLRGLRRAVAGAPLTSLQPAVPPSRGSLQGKLTLFEVTKVASCFSMRREDRGDLGHAGSRPAPLPGQASAGGPVATRRCHARSVSASRRRTSRTSPGRPSAASPFSFAGGVGRLRLCALPADRLELGARALAAVAAVAVEPVLGLEGFQRGLGLGVEAAPRSVEIRLSRLASTAEREALGELRTTPRAAVAPAKRSRALAGLRACWPVRAVARGSRRRRR